MIWSVGFGRKSSTFPPIPLTSCNSYYISASPAESILFSLHQIVMLKNKSVCLTWLSRLFCDAWYSLLNFLLLALGMTKRYCETTTQHCFMGQAFPHLRNCPALSEHFSKWCLWMKFCRQRETRSADLQPSSESWICKTPQVLGSRDYLCYYFKNNLFKFIGNMK